MTEPLALEDYHDLSELTALSLSPDGERVAFVADEFDPGADERRRSLFVAPTDGREPPHRLTRASDARSPVWSPDGTKLGFIASRPRDTALSVGSPATESADADAGSEDGEPADGGDRDDRDEPDDEPEAQVWVYDLARGGDARQVTDREWGVREFDWGPRGDRIVVAARDPTDGERAYLESREDDGPIEVTRLGHKADGVGWLDDVTTYLFVVDAATREATRLDDAYGAGAYEPLAGLQPAWGPGGAIAFCSNRTDDPADSGVYDVFTIEPDGSDLRRVTDGDCRAAKLSWSPDGDRLGFVAGHPTNWYRPDEVSVADLEDGTAASVSGDLDRNPAWNGTPRWVDGETLVCVVADEGRERLVRFAADGSSPERVFAAQGPDETVRFADVAGDTVALTVSHPRAGHDVFTMAVDGLDAGPDVRPLTRVSALNEGLLADAAMPDVDRETFENGDGDPVEGLVYAPADVDPDDPDPRPLIAKIHGGPMSYDAPGFAFDHTYWTGQGYVVLRVNYRGSSSYGRAFCERLRGSRGDLETDDVVSGVEHLVETGRADPDRLFVTGFSYGGITTAHVVTRDHRFAAAAAEHGIYDFYSNFGTDDNHLWHEDEFGLPWENVETYREISSLTDVDRIETPLLVTAGEQDWRCPPTQAEQLYLSAKKCGVDAKLVVYPGEHHAIGKPERAIHRLRTIHEWFEEHDPGGS